MQNIRIDEQYISHAKEKEITRNIFCYDSEKGFLKYILKNYGDPSCGTYFKYNDECLILKGEEIEKNIIINYTEYKYEKTNNSENILKEILSYNANGVLKDHHRFIYENNIRIKTLCKSKDKEYELIHQYKDGVKIKTIYPDGKIHSLRYYNADGSLKVIHGQFGDKVVFTWDNEYTSYDYNMFYIS